ncbi:MAG: galactokinase [Treponema sp.]|jgi:galactokinase|nr:galactokinase [Treponema sp.]
MLDIGPIHHKEYEAETDRSEPVVVAEAPGRIHYLGEHGEPGAGLYLSSAINRYVRAAVSLRKDNSIRFYAADLGERKRTTLVNLKYKREDRWANYIKVAIHVFAELGCPVKGLNFTICGDIPQQAGLAASTAIEVASAMALKGLFQISIGERELFNRLCAAGGLFFEKNVSPVDYLIALSARKDQFLLVDEAAMEVTKIKSTLSRYQILVMDSRVPRLGVEDELTQRRRETKKGLELLSRNPPLSVIRGGTDPLRRAMQGFSFRDFITTDLVEFMGNLPEEIRRRSMHVVQEIRRVYDARDAILRSDPAALSKIILHSHESLRDLYEVSCPEIDWLVKRAQEIEGVLGSRMTGQGFGGCTYTILREDAVGEYRNRLEDYERIFGFHPMVYPIKIATGGRVLSARRKAAD